MQEISSDRQSTSTSTSGEERLTRTVPDTSAGELKLKQSLLILCSLTAVSSVHYKIGDPRTLEDLLEREEDAWLPRVGTEDYKGLLSDAPTDQIISWSGCASAFESAFPFSFPEDDHHRPSDGQQINIDIAELRDQLRHYLEEMSRIQVVDNDDDDCLQRTGTGTVTAEAGAAAAAAAAAAAGPETGAETGPETGAETGLVRRRGRCSSSSDRPQSRLNWKMSLWLVLFSCAVIPPIEAGGQLSSALWDTERLDLPQLAKFLSTSPLFRGPITAMELEDWIGKLKGLFCGGQGH
ncbi:hypothetical protein LTR99_003891 [Exophiala xenobiotica]|uniref:Uncharacterized protein n=1 Tax=Vermiconidia calcicola TaxID=1690605 RepID=A0AAV9PZ70_9PEZI|nr:hypothetical protein LTR99_003891 [Exophiala xenobiotica]KAK5444759.1 hypothetical protein LTR18_004463 [Exophiala xenobiotica]KAK5529790.1 hypothetical protein LTR25_009569 [Vermiconidia calcicola]